MKAVRIHQFGGPEVLRYEGAPDPPLRKDQVLVRVRACAMNHLDLRVREGLPGVRLPHILGSDIAQFGTPRIDATNGVFQIGSAVTEDGAE